MLFSPGKHIKWEKIYMLSQHFPHISVVGMGKNYRLLGKWLEYLRDEIVLISKIVGAELCEMLGSHGDKDINCGLLLVMQLVVQAVTKF
jgi:hypothetical protein